MNKHVVDWLMYQWQLYWRVLSFNDRQAARQVIQKEKAKMYRFKK